MGEIVLVMPEQYRNSSAWESVENTVGKAQYGLPQEEPAFNIVSVNANDFSSIFKTHRNILFADISTSHKQAASELKRNVFAKGQLMIKITVPDTGSFAAFMQTYGQSISVLFQQEEIERLAEKNSKAGNKELAAKIRSAYGISLCPEEGYALSKEDSNFFWLRSEKGRNLGGYEHQVSKGILVYWYSYTDTSMFSTEKLLAVKDSIGKRYISGSQPNSYMVTSYKLMPPEAKRLTYRPAAGATGENAKVSLPKIFAIEIRGLWRMENDFMGGPFISLSMLDEKRGRILTAEGYVFAPQFDKINYLREVEAVIKTVRVD